MFYLPTRCIGGLVLLLAISRCYANAQTQLRYKHTKGDKLSYSVTLQINVEIRSPTVSAKINVTQTLALNETIKSVELDGTATIAQSIQRLQMLQEAGGKNFTVDSQSNREPTNDFQRTLTPILKELVGKEITFERSPLGKIDKVVIPKVVSDAWNKMDGAFGGSGSLESSLRQSTLLLPEKGLSKGDKWNYDAELEKSQDADATMSFTCTLLGEENQAGRALSLIGIQPELKLEPKPKAVVALTLKSFDGEGKAHFDSPAGRITSLTLEQNLKMEAKTGEDITDVTLQSSMKLLLKK